MVRLVLVLFFLSVALFVYAYVCYPALLWIASRLERARSEPAPPAEWPTISITIPAYNEEATIGATLGRLLELDYPATRRQILVVSDASTDRTDELVRSFASRGVELLRQETRAGKTAAENAARALLRGDIIINTDASITIAKDALKPLVTAFGDPSVGVASGRDVSVARAGDTANVGESGYVGYEMWIRDLETRLASIVGASGCFYAIRKDLHMALVPEALSRDFAAALIARERGYRAVSVRAAVCFVPRTSSLRNEYRRKVRTMARGMETLVYKRHLLNPFRYRDFAWMLISHKVCRWLAPWALVAGSAAMLLVGWQSPWVQWGALLGAIVLALAAIGWWWPEGRPVPRLLALPAFAVAGNVAAIHAGLKALRGEMNPIWEPTRRSEADGQRLPG